MFSQQAQVKIVKNAIYEKWGASDITMNEIHSWKKCLVNDRMLLLQYEQCGENSQSRSRKFLFGSVGHSFGCARA